MKVLNVVRSAFRTLVEEQDDTILWLSQCLQRAGADLELLLEGQACHYACLGTPQPALAIGSWRQEHPADPRADIERMRQAGMALFVLEEDLAARGLDASRLQSGVTVLGRDRLPALYANADLVWHW